MLIMNRNNDELLKLVIAEKDKIKLKYKQRLNDIMQHYGVNFDVNYFKDEKINSIKFMNIKNRKGYSNFSIIYDAKTRKMDYMEYDFSDIRMVKKYNHKVFAKEVEDNFKLKMMVAEIERANSEYLKEINEIDVTYKNTSGNSINTEKVLEMNKKNEN